MIDPKVVELGNYNGIPHMLTPVVTDPRKAARALAIAVEEMDKRYELFAEHNVKDLHSYNELRRVDETWVYLLLDFFYFSFQFRQQFIIL